MELNQVEDFLTIQRDLALRLSAVTRLDEGLRVCLETTMKVLRMDCGGIYLIDPTSGALHLAFHKGLSSKFVKDIFHCTVDSPNAKCLMEGKFTYTRRKRLNVPLTPAERQEGLRTLRFNNNLCDSVPCERIFFLFFNHQSQVKGSSRVENRDLKSLSAFMAEYSPGKGYVVCNEKAKRIHGNVIVIPWWMFLDDLWEGKVV